MDLGSGWWSYIRHDPNEKKASVNLSLLRRVAAYARPYRWMIAVMLVTIIGISLLSVIPPLLVRYLIDTIIPQRDTSQLNWLVVWMIGVPLVSGLLGVLQRFLSSRVGEGVIYDLRCALFGHMQKMSLRFFTHTRTGELMSRLNNDVVGSQRAISSTLVEIISNVITLTFVLSIMISLEWRLTLLSILILPVFIVAARRVGNLLREVVRKQLSLNAEMNAMMNETLNVSGALLVKIFGRARDEEERFSDRASKVRDTGIRQSLIGRWFFFGLGLTGAIGVALITWLGGHFVIGGNGFTVGTVVAFVSYLGQLYGPLGSLSNTRVEFATSMVSFERVFEVLDLPVEIQEKPNAHSLDNVRGKVEYRDVSFSYAIGDNEARSGAAALSEVMRWGQAPDASLTLTGGRKTKEEGRNGTSDDQADNAEGSQVAIQSSKSELQGPQYAISNVSFTVQPGQLAALVGPSGAGKTSLTYLLPRLYDPTSGSIYIDDHDIRDVTLQSLASQIGMVTQETYLFHDTIGANLLYARPDATEDQMVEAAKAANIHSFIAGLPDGYDTIVGERGYRLSGGEKQRIAIARVLLKNPRILVLDEATSSLDSQSEALIQAALERLMVGRTSIVIAHRLSTILAADVILVMQEGRLVERGTHSELLALGGLYADLYHTQFRNTGQAQEAAAA